MKSIQAQTVNQRVCAILVLGATVTGAPQPLLAAAQSLAAGYSQSFDTLAASGISNTWTDDATLSGWYSNRVSYLANGGTTTNGSLYSFGTNGERALGSIGSGSTNTIYYGLRLVNDTGSAVSALSVNYTGEQWRNGGNTAVHQLALEYRIGATAITGGAWTPVSALAFTGPIAGSTGGSLDGNASANRSVVSATITGLSLAPGQEIWLRWVDINDAGNDHGLAIDDLTITADGASGDDVPPSVSGTLPTDGAIGVALDANVAVTFSEAVSAGSDAFALSCASSGAHTFSLSGAGQTYTLDPDADFISGETCTVTVVAAKVADQDGTPDHMAADHSFSFTTAAASNACGAPAARVSTVQGDSDGASAVGAHVAIEGIVVGDYQGSSGNSLRGFFLQEEDADADANPATSEGIFVFDGGNPAYAVSVGDRVRVTGTVSEFFGMTQLASVTAVQVCATGQAMPTPATLTLPVPGVPNGDLGNAQAAINAYYEQYEGMLVRFPGTLTVSEYFQLERYGQVVLSEGGRIPTFTAVSPPSAAGYIDHQIEVARRKVILDDKNNVQNSALINNEVLPYPTPGLSITNRFRGGDTITGLTGVLHWSFAGLSGTDAWRVRPVDELYSYAFTAANPRPANVPNVGGSLKVASFNVLNYFTTLDTTASNTSGSCGPGGGQDCRGADSADELTRQTAKAKAALCGMNADIVGLMEIENNASDSLSALATAANSVTGCGPYAYVDTGTLGGDAIKVGLLYKTATVVPVGSHAILTSSEDARFIDDKNRPMLVQTFREIASNEELTVAVNHLKSKGSNCNALGDPDQNDGQGDCNLTRTTAAQAIVDWLASDPTHSGDSDFLIIGDLNSYTQEDPITAILAGADDAAGTADDYTNLVHAFGGSSAYGYVFDGQTGYLDHALASSSLTSQVVGAADWHINADEPPSFDYNDTVADPGEASFEARPSALPLYQADAFRSSDHDPLIIGLDLAKPVNIIDGTPGRDTLIGTPGNDRITGGQGGDVMTGDDGDDVFVYLSTRDAGDTITDFTPGSDRLDLTQLLAAIGVHASNAYSGGYVRVVAVSGGAAVQIDADGYAGTGAPRTLVKLSGRTVAQIDPARDLGL